MLLTKIDCDFFKAKRAKRELFSYVALNPTLRPGNLVAAESAAVQDTIGSQVACRLALEHFVDGVLEFFRSVDLGQQCEHRILISEEVLEAAFKRANQSVYEFGHKLVAGGRMAASLIGLVVQDQNVAAGRVGGHSAYLLRNNKVFPFFDNSSDKEKSGLIGKGQSVVVELASIALQPLDGIAVFSEVLTANELRCMAKLLPSFDWESESVAERIRVAAFADRAETVDFAMTIKMGPSVVYLEEMS